MVTQKQRILSMLQEREWVSAIDIVLETWILSHTKTISELRRDGYDIENKIKHVKKGDRTVKLSFYKLIGE